MPRTGLTLVVGAFLVLAAVGPATAAPAAGADGGDPSALVSNGGIVAETEAGCTYPFTRVDATGTNVTVRDPPERVVTLYPSAAQTMWEIGGQEKVVGMSPYGTYLEDTDGIETVGAYPSDVDTVANQSPDLVLAPNVTFKSTIRQLRARGVTVYHFREAASIERIYGKTRLTGRLVDRCAAADIRVREMRRDVRLVESATSRVEPEPVLHLLGPSGFTAGDGTFVHMIIEKAGGENVGERYEPGYEPGYYRITGAQARASDPAWITRSRTFDLSAFSGTTAVEAGQTIELNTNYVSQPAPRIVQPMLTIVRTLHPEAYEAAQLSMLENGNDTANRAAPYMDADPRTTAVVDGAAVLRVKGGTPPTTEFSVPRRFDPNASARLETVSVSTREPNPIFTVSVERTDRPGLPGAATAIAAYQVETRDLFDQSTGAGYTVRVPLEATGGDPTHLGLYRQTPAGWERIESRVRINRTDATARVSADADRLSAFAVGIEPDEDESVQPDETPSATDAGTATVERGSPGTSPEPSSEPASGPTADAATSEPAGEADTRTATATPASSETTSPEPETGGTNWAFGGWLFGGVTALAGVLVIAGAVVAVGRR